MLQFAIPFLSRCYNIQGSLKRNIGKLAGTYVILEQIKYILKFL